ncbi:MAG: hypothetical protein KGI54_16385 [Pseudomonadota bacterium]|nr:hypothetical protein [Pseudomonadota bacterium]
MLPREEWIKEFVRIIKDRYDDLTHEFAFDLAQENYVLNEGMSPAEAVDEELSYWED